MRGRAAARLLQRAGAASASASASAAAAAASATTTTTRCPPSSSIVLPLLDLLPGSGAGDLTAGFASTAAPRPGRQEQQHHEGAALPATAALAPGAARAAARRQHHSLLAPLPHHDHHHRPYSSAAVAAPDALPSASSRQHRDDDDDPDQSSSLLVAAARRDPFSLVADEVAAVGERMRRTVATEVPALADAALYFLRPGVTGKRLRPTLLLLMAGALDEDDEGAAARGNTNPDAHDDPLAIDLRAPHEPCGPHETRRRQQRVAEVAELIHVASLLHDDVLDEASTRRGVPALHRAAASAVASAVVGAGGESSSSNITNSSSSSNRADKLAILAGDFLLARASVTLAALGDARVVALLSRVLEHLVSGEVMQMAARADDLLSPSHYLRKTYAKTASLMANSCRAVALLSSAVGGEGGGGDLASEARRGGDGMPFFASSDGVEGEDVWGEGAEGAAAGGGGALLYGGGMGEEATTSGGAATAATATAASRSNHPLPAADAAWAYGGHLGLAFQVVDDLLDLTGSAGVLGKPTLSDLRAGLATAPVLMACEEAPELRALVARRFSREGDVARAVDLVRSTRGVERAWALARRHADAAADAVRALPPARTERARAHRAALVALTRRVLERRK